jgi:hypothetical protein
MEPILIDVEEPHRPTETIPLEQAIKTYLLDEVDVDLLKAGQVVWYKDIALSMHRDEGELKDAVTIEL